MEKKNRMKSVLIGLLLVGSILGFGYGMSTALKPYDPPAASAAAAVSDPPMVPANFSDLAEKVRPGVVNLQVVKKVKNVGFGLRGNPFGDQTPSGLLRTLLRGQPPLREP